MYILFVSGSHMVKLLASSLIRHVVMMVCDKNGGTKDVRHEPLDDVVRPAIIFGKRHKDVKGSCR